jgi:hypothetical protein
MILFALLLQAAPLPGPPPVPTAPPSPGQPPATMVYAPVAMAIASFDADGDGRTTAAELSAGVARSYATIDTAGSGSIGFIAFADWAERWLGDRNALPSPFETDSDGDNRIALPELQAQFARVVARLDRDKDGVLTRAELLTLRASVGGAFGPDGRRRERDR